MSEKENKQLIQIPAEKLVDALLHAKQFEQHYATQESVDNLKERMDAKFEQINDRFEQVNDRFEQFNEKLSEYRAEVNQRFAQVDKQFQQVDKRFDEIRADNRHTNNKLDRLQWFIVAAALAFIFKDYVFRSLAGI